MKTVLTVFILVTCLSALLYPQASAALSDDFAQLTLSLSPRIDLPLGEESRYFKTAIGSDVTAKLLVLSFPYISVGTGLSYSYVPLTTVDSVSLLSWQGDLAFNLPLTENWLIGLSAAAGYYYGFLADESKANGGNAFFKIGIGSTFTFLYRYGITAGIHYAAHRALFRSFACSLGLAYHFSLPRPSFVQESREPRITPVRVRKSEQGRQLELSNIDVDDCFPVLYKFYSTHPVGRAILTNWEPVPVTDIELTLFVEDYMDNPKRCAAPPELQAREVAPVHLHALFSPRVLDITESSVNSVLLTLSYKIQDRAYTRRYTAELRLNGRNELSWDDDRKAAAFVTNKDPQILAFAKNVSSWIKQQGTGQIDGNVATAMGLYEALRLYGITYSPDPITPFAEFSRDALAVDFLQFPRETLSYRAGDCDDLSVLYNALLESLAVETAFITIPGHIYPAFAAAVPPGRANRVFSNTDDLVVRNGKVWIPVEITDIQSSFVEAWENGAGSWREFSAAGESAIHPTREAWKLYEPVGLPGFREQITLPDEQQFKMIFQQQSRRLVLREILPRIDALEEQMRRHPDEPKHKNRLGVIYARYRMIPEATEQFESILETVEYLPALLNMGNLSFLNGDYRRALQYYRRAEGVDPERSAVLLGIARSHHALQNYDEAIRYIKRLRKSDPETAKRYEHIGRDMALRSGEMTNAQDGIQWEEE